MFELLVAVRFAAPIVSLSPGPFKKGEASPSLQRDLPVISALVSIRQIRPIIDFTLASLDGRAHIGIVSIQMPWERLRASFMGLDFGG